MNKEKLSQLFAEIVEKIGDGPDSHIQMLRELSEKHDALLEFTEILSQIVESLGSARLIMRYMEFDLAATTRERDTLRTLLEDRDR